MLADHVREGEEAYEFTWVGKKASIVEANRPIRKTLRPCVEESKDWDTTQNLYIEGDNLEALKLLQESYLGKVKMIYIDPPYNTGNDFVYNDDFGQSFAEYEEESGAVDEDGNRMKVNHETDGRFHSKWCSMIYSRLMRAKSFLTKDGVLMISIDDHEVENLKKIATEIFGEKNFVAQLVWEKKKKGAFLSKNYINMKEYVLVYSNGNDFAGLVGEINKNQETYPCIKTTNARGVRVIKKGTPSKYREQNYVIPANTRISSGNMELIYQDEATVKDGILQNDVHIDSNWIYGQAELDKYAKQHLIYITQDRYIRRIVNDERKKMLKDLLTRVGADGKSLKVYQYDENLNHGGWGTNEDANDELHALLGEQYVFNYSKPTRLICKLLQACDDKDALVMDFFSGSGTLADAVMQLNAADGGHRKYLLVQIPEEIDEDSYAKKAGYANVCEIGLQRIKKAGEKVREAYPDEKFDTGFRVLKIDSSNMNDVYYSAEDLTQDLVAQAADNIKSDRSDLDLLFGCLVDWGVELSLPYTSEIIDGCTVHDYADGALVACFDRDVPESVIRTIAGRQPERAVFRDSSFADSPAKINVTEIFKLLSPDTDVRVL